VFVILVFFFFWLILLFMFGVVGCYCCCCCCSAVVLFMLLLFCLFLLNFFVVLVALLLLFCVGCRLLLLSFSLLCCCYLLSHCHWLFLVFVVVLSPPEFCVYHTVMVLQLETLFSQEQVVKLYFASLVFFMRCNVFKFVMSFFFFFVTILQPQDPYLGYFIQSHLKLKDRWDDLQHFMDNSDGDQLAHLEMNYGPGTFVII